MNRDNIGEKKLEIIEDYLKRCYINNSDETVKYHRRKLQQFSKHLKNKTFEEATPEEVVSFIKKYSQSGYGSIKSSLINFYKDLYKLDFDDRLPECVRILKSQKSRTLRKQGKEIQNRERLISPEEYQLLIQNSQHPYQKAIIETLYLFGTRISELLSMRATDVIEGEKITKIIVRESKTKPREVSIMETPQYLLEYYRNFQPFKGEKTKPLWASPHYRNNRKTMRREAVVKMIQQIAIKAGIPKERKITPHDFRHTAISRDLAQGMPQTFVENKYGLIHGSDMIQTYDHNGNKGLEDYYNKNMIDKPETPYAIELKYKQETEVNKKHIDELQNEVTNLKKELNDLKSLILQNSHQKDESLHFDTNNKEHVKFQEKYIDVSELGWKNKKIEKNLKLKKVEVKNEQKI
jgi:site-specific recombinase XerD